MPENPWIKYSLVGENSRRAVELGLAEAEWYTTPVDRKVMRELLERRDGPALRDTIIWFLLLGGFGAMMVITWGSWWFVPAFLAYSVIYASTSDSRWHEAGHGTAFRTDWLNNALYEVASFMVLRESTIWRWSHTRHHSDTIIVGRDPEVACPRPPDIKGFFWAFLPWRNVVTYFKGLWAHARGELGAKEKEFVPASEIPRIRTTARIYLGIYAIFVVAAIVLRSPLPLFFIGLPNIFGSWLMQIYGHTQHTGLAENVLDHRLNCRTIRMNLVNRFLYWNMNYHLEHHMFPLVPYHRLPKLHELIKHDSPEPYPGLVSAWREILTTIFRQLKEPSFHVKRRLPEPSATTPRSGHFQSNAEPGSEGWVEVCGEEQLDREEVVRFDHARKTYAVIQSADGSLFATDGICTHGNQHLSEGLVKDGIIECPKHNGRFHLHDGSPARAPICRGLATYPVEIRNRRIWINVLKPGGAGARPERAFSLRVASNRNVSPFIKELVLESAGSGDMPDFQPGDYLQLEIPAYEKIRFADFSIDEPHAKAWREWQHFDLEVANPHARRNNYSLASIPSEGGQLRFNVRIAMPPPGQDCPPGKGSSWVFSLKPGDAVRAFGPYGDFHIKPTQKEMIYIGGGAGMGPLRSHIAHLFEVEKTKRKVSYWYASRSRQELYYQDYFESLAEQHANFSFHVSLSSPLPEDHWTGLTGRIHEVIEERYLKNHPNLRAVEFYLCGPPMMIDASVKMLRQFGVEDRQMAFDAF
jgi:MocE subfamily Rieske [2Fe-2S] domain protein